MTVGTPLKFALTTAVFLTLIVPPVAAQSGLEEVVVYARKTDENNVLGTLVRRQDKVRNAVALGLAA